MAAVSVFTCWLRVAGFCFLSVGEPHDGFRPVSWEPKKNGLAIAYIAEKPGPKGLSIHDCNKVEIGFTNRARHIFDLKGDRIGEGRSIMLLIPASCM